MCGIVGIIGQEVQVADTHKIKSMADAVLHRGPDDEAYYRSPNGKIVFGHRRLSIVGLDDRPTVMSIAKKNNPLHRIAIVFNGEIYNYKQLKQTFSERGYRSVSPSDFEVIVFAWEEWGEKCVDHLEGEFAFVLYDEETDDIFMARDRTGVKPLFYGTRDDRFYFASEPKGILAAWPKEARKINNGAVGEFILGAHAFAAGTPRLGSSFFEGIYALPPGHCARIENGAIKLRQYWDLPFADTDEALAPTADEIRDVMTKAVLDRVPDETDVCIGLSGGLDSSIVASVVAASGREQRVSAASVNYSDEMNADFEHAKYLAHEKGIELFATEITKESLLADIDRCIVAMDGPLDTIRRMAMLANYRTMHEQGYKVALIGEGSDEFNLGYYHTFPGLKIDVGALATPEAFQDTLRARAEFVKHYFSPETLLTFDFEGIIQHTVDNDYLPCKSSNPLIRMQYFYAKRFLTFLEDSNDRVAMANSVEARLPFVDRAVIETCVRVPVRENVTDTLEKMALRHAFAGIVPEKNLNREKAPFPASRNKKMYKLLLGLFREEMVNASAGVWSMLNKQSLEKLADRFDAAITRGDDTLGKWLRMRGDVDVRTSQVMAFLTLLRWYRLYFIEYVG